LNTITKRSLEKNDWPLVERDGLTLIESPLLKRVDGIVHAFTTRLGGDTPEPLNWFNLGRHWPTEESRQEAMRNRDRLCNAVGLDAKQLTVPGQQHTTNIFLLKDGEEKGLMLPNFDGVATEAVNHPILLHFADCVPVMLFDKRKRFLCVMHAGWRGTAGGIVTKGVQLLKATLDCNPSDMVAAVGPAIGACCYETGEDVAEHLAATIDDKSALSHLVQRSEKTGKPRPDLKAINGMQLYEAGVGEVDITSWCTACRPDLFYSHRQSGGKTGRQGALACLI
jgi:YfiH family protein